jgi:hypothetical protein
LRTLLALATVLCGGQVFAGSPPLITDDPETPGYRGWEINITSSLEHTRDGVEMENPLFDINYGLTSDRDQLKVEFAVLSNDPQGNQEAEWGVSDLLIGYKYRFLDADENHGWAVSFYPQVSTPTGDASRDLGSGQTEMLFPFEFQKSFFDDKVWVNPEIGYNVVFNNAGQNGWKIGLAAGREYENGWELEGEVGTFVFEGNSGEPDVPFFNFGFDYTITKNVHLLGSAGRSFRSSHDGTPDFFCLLGFQFLFGAAAEEENPAHEEGGEKGADEDQLKNPGEAHLPSYLRSTAGSSRRIPQYLVNPAEEGF